MNDSSFSSTTISKETAVFDESTIDQIITSELADDDTINITIKSQGTSGQTFEVGKPFLILPGSDESYPFGLSGKISALETNAAGDQVVTLEPITLREVAEESTLDLQSVALSAENFIGVIAPSAIQEAALEARQSASSLPAGAKSALNGGVVVYSEKKTLNKTDSFLNDSGEVGIGKVSLNLPILELDKMVDDPKTTQPYGGSLTPPKLEIKGSLDNLKLVQTHVMKKTGGMDSFELSVEGDLSTEVKISGAAEFSAGYFSRAWDEVNDESFNKYKIKGKIKGLDSDDKIGDYPLVGLLFSVPCGSLTGCPVLTGQTQTPLRQTKAGGVIIWIYYTLNGEVSLKGEIGTRANFGFKLGAGLNEEGELVNKSELTEPSSGRMVEAIFIDGELDYEAKTGVSFDVDFFAGGIRAANLSLGVLAKINGTMEAESAISYGITKKDDPWGWEGGNVCMNSSIGAGVLLSGSVELGVEIDTLWKKASGSFEYTNQIPSESEIDLPGLHGLWYTIAGKERCFPIGIPTGVLVVSGIGSESNTNKLTWQQVTRYTDIYTRDDSTGQLSLIKSGHDLGAANDDGAYMGYFTHEYTTGDGSFSYVLVAVDEDGNSSDSTSGVSNIGFTAINADDVNTITWNEVSGASQYDLQYTKQSIVEVNRAFITRDNVESPVSHINIGSGETWYYKMRYVDASGNVGPWSAEVSVTRPAVTEIAAPQNVAASAADSEIIISWNNVAGADKYTLYLAEESGVTPANYTIKTGGRKVDDVSSPYRVNGLSSGTNYYAVVTATAGGVESAASVEVSAKPAEVIPPVATGKLNDTGITQCADATTNGLSCPVTGYPDQDAQYGGDFNDNNDSDGHAGFSFTKLDNNGNELLANATEWSCVKDDVTGLTWEVKQGGNGTIGDEGLHDADDQYTWHSLDSKIHGGWTEVDITSHCHGYDIDDSLTYCNTEAFTQRVNQQGLCGARNWRIPTREELRSIVAYDRGFPSIDNAYFPKTRSAGYWSISSSALGEVANWSFEAWGVSFGYGSTAQVDKGSGLHVRLVWGEKQCCL